MTFQLQTSSFFKALALIEGAWDEMSRSWSAITTHSHAHLVCCCYSRAVQRAGEPAGKTPVIIIFALPLEEERWIQRSKSPAPKQPLGISVISKQLSSRPKCPRRSQAPAGPPVAVRPNMKTPNPLRGCFCNLVGLPTSVAPPKVQTASASGFPCSPGIPRDVAVSHPAVRSRRSSSPR